MKVIYKKPITDKIYDAICEADCKMKKIEKIILTRDEWDELRVVKLWTMDMLKMYFDTHTLIKYIEFAGVRIERERV